MQAAPKAPKTPPSPTSTQSLKVRAREALPKHGCGVLDDEERARDARHGSPHRRGDEVEAERIGAHEGGGVAILGDGANGRDHEGAGEEEVEADHGEDGQPEGDQAGKRDEDAPDLEHGEGHPHRAMIGAPEQGGERLDEEEQPVRS